VIVTAGDGPRNVSIVVTSIIVFGVVVRPCTVIIRVHLTTHESDEVEKRIEASHNEIPRASFCAS